MFILSHEYNFWPIVWYLCHMSRRTGIPCRRQIVGTVPVVSLECSNVRTNGWASSSNEQQHNCKIKTMSDNNGDLDYPHLAICQVTLTGTAASSRPPVRLPLECVNAVETIPPYSETPFDFSLGKFLR